MLKVNMQLKYSLLTILSTGKKSFENMGRFIKKSGDTVSRFLPSKETSFENTQKICQSMFKNKKKISVL